MKRLAPLLLLLGAGPAHAALDAGDAASTDGGADAGAAPPAAAVPPPVLPAPPQPAPAPAPLRLDDLTVVGTREARTAGSAHVLRSRDLERLNQDNPEKVVQSVPGVYTRGEDGVGLRPNIGIRGTSPDRSKKVTLMEDGILFGPAPYAAPAAYYFPLITRMESVRVIKGPGAVTFGPQTVGGALDLVTRRIPGTESGGIDLAGGQYAYGKVHGHFGASTPRTGYVLEGVHVRSDGWKELDGGGNTGFSRNEWMWKGRYRLSTDPNATQELGLKLGYSDEDSRETYLGLGDADFRDNPLRRYRASRLDEMEWHRTQIVGTYHAEIQRAFTVDVAAYRHDLARTWRKVNRFGGAAVADVLANPTTPRNAIFYGVLTGELDTTGPEDTLFIGPNRRTFVSQGAQATAGWRGLTGPVGHRLELGARLHYDRIERLHEEQGFMMRGGRLVPDGGPVRTTANNRAWAHALAVHATDAATWGPLTLTPGLRVELISTFERDRLAGIEAEGSPQRVVIPGVGAYVALTDGLGVLAGVYRGFSPAGPGQPDAVDPETSVNYEAGARLRQGPARLEAIGFFNDYRNLTSICTLATGCAADRVDTQYDAGRARIWGAEAFAQVDVPLGRGLTLPFVGAYTFTRTRLLDSFVSEDPTLGRVEEGDQLPYVPRHQASATLALEHRFGGLAVGAWYVSAMREEAGQGPAPPGTETDDSFLLDVMVRGRFGRGELYLNVRNLLDAQDLASRRPYGARPVAPRWLQVGLRFAL